MLHFSQPLFLYLAYQAPRVPIQVPSEYEDMYMDIEHLNRRKFAGKHIMGYATLVAITGTTISVPCLWVKALPFVRKIGHP